MAKLRSNKGKSIEHEEYIARSYGGERVRNSGAVANLPGDVRTPDTLFECKTTGEPTKPAKSISISLAVVEKAADEAWSVGLQPAISYRIYNPSSVLADGKGYVYLTLRLTNDDKELYYVDAD